LRHFFATCSKYFVLISFKSSGVLLYRLLCKAKKRKKYYACLTAKKAKSKGWRGLINRSNPCFELISLAFAVFCP